METADYFGGSKFVKELGPQDFDPKATWKLKDKECSIVLWYAPWCTHCKAIKGTWEELGKDATFLNVLSFNSEKNKGHLAKIQEDMPELLREVPTVILYKGGEPFEEYKGTSSIENLLKTSMRVCQS